MLNLSAGMLTAWIGGYDRRAAANIGLTVLARGEFSLILASLALAAGLDSRLGPFTGLYACRSHRGRSTARRRRRRSPERSIMAAGAGPAPLVSGIRYGIRDNQCHRQGSDLGQRAAVVVNLC